MIAYGSLIFLGNDRIYYIGLYAGDHSRHVYGFIRNTTGVWTTVSPTYAAYEIYHQPVASQQQADGALIYDLGKDRIYYRGVSVLLFYYLVIDLETYHYNVPALIRNFFYKI